jgi:predicted nucleic acid-binding protein
MAPRIVFVDATVLVSRSTRDWLLHIRSVTNRNMFVVACTRDVIVEALNTLRNLHPSWPGRMTTELMNSFLEALDIVDDFDAEIAYSGPDPDDRHVHAAAIAAQANFLVTDDTGFKRMASDDTPYEVITADDFFVLVDDGHPHVIAEATRNQIAWWTNQKRKPELVARLKAAGCPTFAERVAGHIQVQSGNFTRSQRRLARG